MATIRTTDGRRSVTAELGPQVPAVSGGRGGWAEVQRPRRPAAIEWQGAGLRQATVQLFLDGFASNRAITGSLSALEAMAPTGATSEPPTVTVTGAWPVPGGVTWVIQDLAVSDQVLRASDGRPVRAMVTVSLLEHREPELVVRSTAAKRAQSKQSTTPRAGSRTYTVRSGDTLAGIAAAELGSAKRWQEIATLNGIRDPNRLTVGQKLRMPR
jgi:LysM repeat protein